MKKMELLFMGRQNIDLALKNLVAKAQKFIEEEQGS